MEGTFFSFTHYGVVQVSNLEPNLYVECILTVRIIQRGFNRHRTRRRADDIVAA